MWPGQQPPGGEQNPQNSNPYQQPGYQQPNPYQQPGYQQPNPYQAPHPPQQPAPPRNPPVAPGGPQPPRGGRKRVQTTAITAAVAVVAAAAVTAVFVLRDNGGTENTSQQDAGQSASPEAPPSETGSEPADGGSSGAVDNPRGGSDSAVKPVIAGWQPVVNAKRQNVFDVPPGWDVKSQGLSIGFTDENDTSDFPGALVMMSAPAVYQEKWCTYTEDGYDYDTSLAAVGTKGAQGAKSTAEAAENEALNWVHAGYDQQKTGTFKTTKATPFTSEYGITGHSASATVTGVGTTEQCSSDGKSFTVSYKAANGDLATWVLYAARGVKEEVTDATIQKIMSTLRPLGTAGGSGTAS
jgi:hypothetical protein